MIYKIYYNTALFNFGKENTYISFCDKKLCGNYYIHCILYKTLFDAKIITFTNARFSYEIRNDLSGRFIKCFFINDKPKLFCTLRQLTKPKFIGQTIKELKNYYEQPLGLEELRFDLHVEPI